MEPRTKSRHVAKREFWQHQISKWKVSGLSQKQYCRSRSLALSTFCYWKSRINKPESSAPRFFPLVIPDSHTSPSDAGLLLFVGPKQFKIEIKEDFSATVLRKLIATLEQL